MYTPIIQPRIRYVFELVLGDLLLFDNIIFTEVLDDFISSEELKINYSQYYIDNIPFVVPSGLLSEEGVQTQDLVFETYRTLPYAFGQEKAKASLPFDLFSFLFYLVSRYEEYLPFEADEHGRFTALRSIAYQQGFLHLPVVDLWTLELKKILLEHYPNLKLPEQQYQFTPTYDIDYAYAFKYKSAWRQTGAFFRSLLKGDGEDLKLRLGTFLHLRKDPFYTFGYMLDLDKRFDLNPIYFLHIGDNGPYDKNIRYTSKGYKGMVEFLLSAKVPIGIHPSYESNRNFKKVEEEILRLSNYTKQSITKSRQHYVKVHQPQTYQNLIKLGIKEDYSMGYANQNGFRASIARPFKWYDLEKEQATELIVYPFQLMDVTFKNYQEVSLSDIPKQAQPIIDATKQVKGHLICTWHNSSFCEHWTWKGWSAMYEELLVKMK
ncbi:MAG: hypothetical protein GY810_23850 [Aureispira sp.]|nr:hypothetical protein [Aureispira sp.]